MHRVWCKTRQKQLAYKEEQRIIAESRPDPPAETAPAPAPTSPAPASATARPSYLSALSQSSAAVAPAAPAPATAAPSDAPETSLRQRLRKKLQPHAPAGKPPAPPASAAGSANGDSIGSSKGAAPEAGAPSAQQLTEQYLARPEPGDPTAVFCVPLEEGLRRSARVSPDLPDVLSFCLAYIERHGLDEVGVFRLSGSLREVATLRHLFQCGQYPGDDDIHDVNAATNLLKLYFRELPQPLFEPRSDYVPPSSNGGGGSSAVSPYRAVLDSLSPERRKIAWALFRLLSMVVANSARNKMSSANLAIVLSPTLHAPSDTVCQLAVHFHEHFTPADAAALPPDWPHITAQSRCTPEAPLLDAPAPAPRSPAPSAVDLLTGDF